MTHEEIKKVKLETLWWVIDHFQEMEMEDNNLEIIDDDREINQSFLTYHDVQKELYTVMKMIDPKECDWIPVKERYPDKAGEYEVKMHTGSIRPRIVEMKTMFTIQGSGRPLFSGTGDWNYVSHWKPVKII